MLAGRAFVAVLVVTGDPSHQLLGFGAGFISCLLLEVFSVVAAQSVSVLGAQLAPSLGAHAEQALVFSLAMWLGGGMLYLWIISLIFYRYTFFTMNPSDLAPPY